MNDSFDFEACKRDLFALGLNSLPDDPRRYFLEEDGTVDLLLTRLVPIRARPERIVNANKLMRQAYDGLIEKREAVLVRWIGKERYAIQDGNSTYANAVLSSWKSLPCRITTGKHSSGDGDVH